MNKIVKGYKFRIYPNAEQRAMIAKTIGCSRFVFNNGLKERRDAYSNGVKLQHKDLSKQLTELKKQEDFSWLSDVPATCLNQSLRDLDTAYKNFFNKTAKYPTFKHKTSSGSIRMQDVVYSNGILKLPKLGKIKVKWSQELSGIPKMATVSIDSSGRYFVSFQVETELELLPIANSMIGIDVGLKQFCFMSNGDSIENPRYLKNKQKALARSQRNLARKQKESKRREKARKRVAKIHTRITDTRKDFLHKASSKIVKDHDLIVVEDLKIKNLLKNKRLSKSIADASWGEFLRQLEYKSNWYGRTFIRVSPHNTSRDCSCCGHRHEVPMTLNIREWTCSNCGTLHDRDLNASINILKRGLEELQIPWGTGKLTDNDIISSGVPNFLERETMVDDLSIRGITCEGQHDVVFAQ